MASRRFAIAVVASLAAAICLAAQRSTAQTLPPFDHAQAAKRALERYIRPGYKRLADATAGLAQAIEKTCKAGQRKPIDKAFDVVVEAWGRIEPINFGPITDDNRADRFLFWPDRKGLGSRQVNAALQTRDASVTEPKSLAAKSIALQGLAALDLVLYDKTLVLQANTPADAETSAFRCAYAGAIAGNLAGIARDLSEDWSKADGFAQLWLAPGPANPAFKLPAETTFALAKALDHGLERVRDDRLAGPLGLNKQKGRVAAPLPASGRGMRLATANVAGLADLFAAFGLEAMKFKLPMLPGTTVAKRGAAVSLTLRQVRDRLAKVGDTRLAPESASVTSAVIAVGAPLNAARTEASDLLASAAGIATGFSATDGD